MLLGQSPRREDLAAMAILLSRLYWDKKVKIALLTLATFAALC